MKNTLAFRIARSAVQAMLYEVCASPKPGLVDRNNQGAHRDMNIFTFVDSSVTLFPTFYYCAEKGLENWHRPPGEVFSAIREIGIRGEKEMLYTTRGVNTQKGLIFALGIICAALGIELSKERSLDVPGLIETVRLMVKGIVDKDLRVLDGIPEEYLQEKKLTAGQKLYLRYGITGIRGEAEAGFPTVIKYGFPAFKNYMQEGVKLNDAIINTLLHIMTVAEDTNVLWRAGKEGLEYMRKCSSEALTLGGMMTLKGQRVIKEMDEDFIAKNISPGGSADLLAVTVFLYMILHSKLN
jgi:triphosphoribosyl-dephospho-CoA synthase